MVFYDKHYKRMGNLYLSREELEENPEKYSLSEDWLPGDKNAAILDIGCGWGNLLLQLMASGYNNLSGIDISSEMIAEAKKKIPEKIKVAYVTDAIDFLCSQKNKWDLILLFDVIEHMPGEQAVKLLTACKAALRENGTLVVRTPNMGNIFASYLRYIDFTHQNGYTEWSMCQLLETAGFNNYKLLNEKIFNFKIWALSRPFSGIGVRPFLNVILHKFLFRLSGINPAPSVYSNNLNVQAWKNKKN